MNKLAISLIIFYKKYISPNTKPRCRFSPTCSEYALESFKKFGFLIGFYLTVKRILKCNPLYNKKYYDNVPLFKEDIFKSEVNMLFIKNYPLPISGLFLSMLTLGNILQVYSEIIRIIIAIIVILFYLIYLIKLIVFKEEVKETLSNPLVASSFPVIAMASVVLSSYLNSFSLLLAKLLWYGAFFFYLYYIPYFSFKFWKKFDIKNIFPTWYIVYVGFAIFGIFSKVVNNYLIGQISFWFGLVSFILLLPIICYRVLKYSDMLPLQKPSLIVLAAPASLLFLSYYFAVENKNKYLLLYLFLLSIFFYIISLFLLPKIIKAEFYPTLSAITFPMVTGAYVSRLSGEYFVEHTLFFNYLYLVQLCIAVFAVSFTFLSYGKYFYKNLNCR